MPFPKNSAEAASGYDSSSFSFEVKNAWSYTASYPYIFMVWCLIKYKQKYSFGKLTAFMILTMSVAQTQQTFPLAQLQILHQISPIVFTKDYHFRQVSSNHVCVNGYP
jgi:hypothetical protein